MKILDLENAIETALTALKAAGTVNAAEVINEPTATIKEIVSRLGARPPFVVAAYAGGGLRPLNLAAGIYLHQPEYVALVGVTRVRPATDTARDALHPIIADVMQALSGKKLGLDIEAIKFTGRISLVSWSRPLMIYGLTFSTEFKWKVSEEAS